MKLKLTINSIIEQLFPRHCIICNALNHELCPSCRLRLITAPQFCPLCSKKTPLGFICSLCRAKKELPYFDAICVYGNSEQKLLSRCLNALRNNGQKNIGYILAKIMCQKIMKNWPETYDYPKLIIPWPLSNLEERQRGYNQNLYLAQGFNNHNDFIISKRSLMFKTRKNRTFRWSAEKIKQNNVIIISDYLPDEKLINLAAQTIKMAGAKKVVFIALSYKL